MFTNLVIAVLITASGSATADGWAPFRAFMGTWSGTRTTSSGKVPVTRSYEAIAANQHLLVTDRVASERAPWGMVSFDSDRQGFVLRRFDSNGNVVDFVLSSVSDGGDRLVFDAVSNNGAAGVERITHERHGWDEYVERVEAGTNATALTVVSETQFHRKR